MVRKGVRGMKVLNLYAGIGGNRKLWEDVEVTAVEMNPRIAAIYQDFFPNDKVIVGDAHQYLLEHFGEFEFIWSSPPCPTHSRVRKATRHQNPPIYPDMTLYQQILLLKHYFEGKFCIENVIPYYTPLIPAIEVDNHLFWTNFTIGNFPHGDRCHDGSVEELQRNKGFNIEKYENIGVEKKKILRNCVNPYLGLHILNESKRDVQPELFGRKGV